MASKQVSGCYLINARILDICPIKTIICLFAVGSKSLYASLGIYLSHHIILKKLWEFKLGINNTKQNTKYVTLYDKIYYYKYLSASSEMCDMLATMA